MIRLDSDGEEVYQCTQCNKDLCDQGQRCGDDWCMDCMMIEMQRSATKYVNDRMVQELEGGHDIKIVETYSTDTTDFYRASDHAWACTNHSSVNHNGADRSASWAYQKRGSGWNGRF